MRDKKEMKFYYNGFCTTTPHFTKYISSSKGGNYFKKSSLSLDILAKHTFKRKFVCVLVFAQCFVLCQRVQNSFRKCL